MTVMVLQFPNEKEVLITDGITLGTIQNNIKGYVADELFQDSHKVDYPPVKGLEVKERTFISDPAIRSILLKLSESQMVQSDILKSVRAIDKTKSIEEHVRLVKALLERLATSNVNKENYRLLIAELGKCSPVSILLPSPDPLDLKLICLLLDKKKDIYTDFNIKTRIQNGFPLINKIILQILKVEQSSFLPLDVANIFKQLVKFRKDSLKLARQRAVARVAPGPDFKAAQADIYPADPVHTLKNVYEADNKPEKNQDKSCQKIYPETATMTGGLTTVVCMHSVVRGFTVYKDGESAYRITDPVLRRFPKRVRAAKRFFIYGKKSVC